MGARGGSQRGGNSKDTRGGGKGGGKEFDKGRGGSSQGVNRKDHDRKKDGFTDKKDNFSEKKKESSNNEKKKDNYGEKKSNSARDKRENRNERNSQPKEFNPVFHGKSVESKGEKLDKYERSLFGEEQGTRNKFSREKVEPQQRYTEKSQFHKSNENHKHQNGHNDNRNRGGSDQDFGQWNGNRRQGSGLSKEERDLSNGMQNMSVGGSK